MGLWRPLPAPTRTEAVVGGTLAGVPFRRRTGGGSESWWPEDLDIAEWACRPHAWDYSSKDPSRQMSIWAEVDQATQKVVAYRGHINQQEQETTIWMDGRPASSGERASTRRSAFRQENGTETCSS